MLAICINIQHNKYNNKINSLDIRHINVYFPVYSRYSSFFMVMHEKKIESRIIKNPFMEAKLKKLNDN